MIHIPPNNTSSLQTRTNTIHTPLHKHSTYPCRLSHGLHLLPYAGDVVEDLVLVDLVDCGEVLAAVQEVVALLAVELAHQRQQNGNVQLLNR